MTWTVARVREQAHVMVDFAACLQTHGKRTFAAQINAIENGGGLHRARFAHARGCRSLSGRRDPAHHVGTGLNSRRRPENHHFGLVWDNADQWLVGEAVGHQHERSRSAPIGHHLSQLVEAYTGLWILVRNESPGALDLTDAHQGRSIHAAAYGCQSM